ncbi:segregation/condensation protein A [Candidatus Woesearchaeota archaeon]|jgi:segregation and condensation protein A|nr:segregation/condensation protein A [Candidatus Woesearchaeota archaeon]MBT5397113.1 segregation/condensation protein A [Candidatus Woesearchaeota archaeon]MBT5924460.1 segregation/condensation protein A [Candidatus Woesearchaeota archaeon]MBT6367341.1 segregation/condensation protein A [Candidatus Woesearchaeota archaeon]MBT7762513.1 segregation/condensation protein A [Candidatus Woesearchaeota archaeon]
MQEQIFDMILQKEELSWKSIIQDLVKTEQMNPWDVNITLLTQKYIGLVKEMQELNLRVSGKVLLAAAFLLRMKSTHLVDEGISKFDELMNQNDEDDMEDFFEDMNGTRIRRDKTQFPLIPRNPQPRNRKVSIHDLVSALQQAMSTRKRALAKIKPVKFNLPDRKVDIMEVIRDVYHKVSYYMKKDNTKTVQFSRLLPVKAGKQEKVFTFLPLLHLEHQQKLVMNQKVPFDEIHVKLMKGK